MKSLLEKNGGTHRMADDCRIPNPTLPDESIFFLVAKPGN